MSEQRYWRINVSGYGHFIVKGSEENARRRAADKGEWEHGIWQIRELTGEEFSRLDEADIHDMQDVDKVYAGRGGGVSR